MFMNLVFYVFIHFLFHLLPPRHLIHHYLSQQQIVSILVFMHLCLHTFPFSPTSSTTSLSVIKQRVSYYCIYESSLLCLYTFPFSPTSSTTSYSPLSVTKQRVSYYCVYESSLLCLHTFPFSPTSSTTSYSPLSVTTTDCKYSSVYASMSSYISFFTYFLHDITICHKTGSKLLLCL